jgi:uncharacterized protein YutE (UPF0331/DUF86 family)
VDIEDVTVLNLQRAAQAAIDLAAHVVVAEGYGLPDSLAAAFSELERQGLIDAELAGRLRKMVGFRAPRRPRGIRCTHAFALRR